MSGKVGETALTTPLDKCIVEWQTVMTAGAAKCIRRHPALALRPRPYKSSGLMPTWPLRDGIAGYVLVDIATSCYGSTAITGNEGGGGCGWRTAHAFAKAIITPVQTLNSVCASSADSISSGWITGFR